MSELILASASPRRSELLKNMGLDFTVVVSDADESRADKSVEPGIYVQELAFLKAAASAKKLSSRRNKIVIAADTVVVSADGALLGKPETEQAAFNMLRSLSGVTHKVYTGYSVMRLSDGKTVCESVCTSVKFRELSDERIKRYIKTGEPMDKAGAYGIQQLGALLVEKIDGDYFNVVGLPVGALAKTLEEEFGFRLI